MTDDTHAVIDRPAFQPPRPAAWSQLLPSHHPRCSQGPAHASRPTGRELHVQKTFHLPPEGPAVAVPPDFFHPRHAVYIQIFHSHHFVKPETPVGAADAARLHTAMRSLADSETRDHVIHHHGAARIRRANFSPRLRSGVHTLAAKPYPESFASLTASSSSSNAITGSTGPKVSSRMIRISCVTSASTVGA